MVVNALSIDVEEYYHGIEFEAAMPGGWRSLLPSRVEPSVDRVLGLLVHARVRATFFILGCVAASHSGMVRRIAADGHEIACHGYDHEMVSRQTPEDFRSDVRRAKHLLENLSGQEVLGYRAPNYSINNANQWAYDILLAEGFRYDSSLYPIFHDRYGAPDSPRFPYLLRQLDGHALWEFPIGTIRLMGVNIPIGGGGPFRLFPYPMFRAGIQAVNRREKKGVIFYFHPWELDAGQPRPAMPWHHRFRHYVNLQKTETKLRHLLRDIPFAPAREVLKTYSSLSFLNPHEQNPLCKQGGPEGG